MRLSELTEEISTLAHRNYVFQGYVYRGKIRVVKGSIAVLKGPAQLIEVQFAALTLLDPEDVIQLSETAHSYIEYQKLKVV